mgnify:FL=1|jgi:CubicO group peptidase (beta-lactamase class C family)
MGKLQMKFDVQAALGILVMLCCSVIGAQAEELTPAEELGISAERLQRVDQVASRYVEEGRVMGMVTMITRHGKLVQTSAQGVLGMDNELPVQADTLFRIYSMTKAVTAVAALILYEEGHFHLDDPVEKFLPDFKDMQVYENGALRPAKIKMTMHHLFTHMSGLSYGYGDEMLTKLIGEADLVGSQDVDTFVERLSRLPLHHDPGEGWKYGYSSDVLGAVVANISGQSLGEFMKSRLFEPLQMQDTFFAVPAEKLHRLASSHAWNKAENGMLLVSGLPFQSGYRVAPFDAGGFGLISTAGDYLKFLEMLRRGGEVDGKWLLSPKLIKYMAKDHLPRSITEANIGPDHDRNLGIGGGHGLGIGVYIDPIRRGVLSSKGELDWGGAAGTVYWLDPVEDVIVICMSQLFASPWRLRDDLSVAIYQSLTVSLE